MLDLAEIVVINKFDKRGAAGRAARRAQAVAAQPCRFEPAEDGHPGLPDDRQPVQRPGRHLDVRQPLPGAADAAPELDADRWRPDARRPPSTSRVANVLIPAQPGALPGRDRRAGPRRSTPTIERQAEAAATRPALYEALEARRRRAPEPLEPYAGRRVPDRRRSRSCAAPALQRGARASSAPRRSSCSRLGPRDRARSPPRPTATRCATTRSPARTTARRSAACRSRRSPPPRLDGWGDRLRFCMKENLPGGYPYTGGVFPYRRDRRGPDPHVRRRGHARAHQPPLPLPVRRASRPHGCRRRSTR